MSNNGSPRSVGEIDTRPPFQSVKAALNLFVEVSGSNKLSTRPSFKKKLSENVMDKETQLMLAHRQLNKFKHRLETAEAARLRAIPELERANRTLRDLTAKLETVTESKLAAEAVKERVKKLEVDNSEKEVGTEAWKKELETTRKDYAAASAELDESKKELSEIRRNFDAALEAKHAAFQAAGEAHRSANSGAEKARELSGEISAVRASSAELYAAAWRAAAAKERLTAEQESGLEAHRAAMDGARRVGAEIKAAMSEIEAAKGARESDEQRLFEVMKLGEVAKGAIRERDEVAKGVQVAEKEIGEWRLAAEAAEKSLVEAAAEAEEARAKERRAVADMTIMSLAGNVRLSAEAFESLSRRAEAAKRGAEFKEAESKVSAEATNPRKIEAEAKREANLKAIEEIKTATDLALRSAEMCDSAKNVVENELRKWRHEEQLSGQLLY